VRKALCTIDGIEARHALLRFSRGTMRISIQINRSRFRRASIVLKNRKSCVVSQPQETMMKWIIAALALVLASSALAMTRAPLQQANDMVINVREACEAGMHRVNGVCIRIPARRAASRCARGVTC
jgi:hypothetical protein